MGCIEIVALKALAILPLGLIETWDVLKFEISKECPPMKVD